MAERGAANGSDIPIQRGVATSVVPDFRWSLVVALVPVVAVVAIFVGGLVVGPGSSSEFEYVTWTALGVGFLVVYGGLIGGRLVRARARARRGAGDGAQSWAFMRATSQALRGGQSDGSLPRRIGAGWMIVTSRSVRVYSQLAPATPIVELPRAELTAVDVLHPMPRWGAGPVLALSTRDARVEIVLVFGGVADLYGGRFADVQEVAARIRR